MNIINEINSYLQLEDITSNNEVISAYDLYNILKEKFQELWNTHYNKELLCKINLDKISELGLTEEEKLPIYCDNITAKSLSKQSTLTFSFNEDNCIKCLEIMKDSGNNELHFDDSNIQDEDFVIKYYNDIMESFAILEKFNKLFNHDMKEDQTIEQVFSFNFLDVFLHYTDEGLVTIYIKANIPQELNNNFNRDWIRSNDLSRIIVDNRDALLKKIPVNIKELDDCSRRIVLDKLQPIKGKKLERKINN